jgi:hypothetical protein
MRKNPDVLRLNRCHGGGWIRGGSYMATTPIASAGHQVARFRPSERAARTAAVLAAVGFVGLALFQVALAAGADWGHAAWGGANAELSSAQRIGSAVAVLIWTAAALVVLGRAGLLWSGRGPARLYRWGTWVAAAGSALGSLANVASQSRYENVVLGPLALALAILCAVVARSQLE